MNASSLKALGFSERYVLFTALLRMIKANDGTGFHNNDQGHPAYVVGKSGKYDYDQLGDSPDRNALFQMMKTLSESLEGCTDFAPEDFVTDWDSFCRLATAAYEAHRKF
jgi:hypothetical protein